MIFVICRATLPQVTFPSINAKLVTENEWFKLAKETGLIYAALVLPIVVVAIYGALLRFAGRVLVAMLLVMFPPSPRRKQFRLLSSAALEPLALTLKKSDFDMTDLVNQSTNFFLKYQSKKTEAWENYQKSIEALTKNAQIYLGDFLLFAVLWGVLFMFGSHAAWIEANQSHFWPVALMLLGLAWFAWFRVSRAVAIVPSLLLIFVSAMLRIDPDVAPLLDVPDKDRDQVRRKLEVLLQKEREAEHRGPSLYRFLSTRFGFSRPDTTAESSGRPRGLPFPSLYKRGSRFAWDKAQYERYNEQWLPDYIAFLYYRLHTRLSNFARTLGQLIRYIVTGAP
jgi:hypothetical protein